MRVVVYAVFAMWLVVLSATFLAKDATPGPIQNVSNADPTVVALEKEKLAEEVEQLREENDFNLGRWLAQSAPSLGSAMAAVVVGIFGVYRYFKDREDARDKKQSEDKRHMENRRAEREQRAENQFRMVLEGLASERVEAQIGAAVTLRTFLRDGAERYARQAFDLAAAQLRLSAPTGRATEATHALTAMLSTVLSESFPVARGEMPLEHRKPTNWVSARPVWRTYAHLDARRVRVEMVTILQADFRYATFGEAQFLSSDLTRCDLSGAFLVGAWFDDATLRGAQFIGAQCDSAKFQNADLEGADFTGADMMRTNIERARVLTGAIMHGVTGLSADQRASCINKGAILDL